MKSVDTLYHFTRGGIPTISAILKDGFMPSYAVEIFQGRQVLLPMISFSNILLRDVGKAEVLDYGEYAIGTSRKWGIQNELNPVLYSHSDGTMKIAIDELIQNAVFLSSLEASKQAYKQFSDTGHQFSKHVRLDNTSPEVLSLMDSLLEKGMFNENVLVAISRINSSTFQSIKQLMALVKPYEVWDRKGNKFVAYNDREWRRTFPDLGFIDILTEPKEFGQQFKAPKPHITDPKYRTTLKLEDIQVIVVKNTHEIQEIIDQLIAIYGPAEVSNQFGNSLLQVNTLDQLIALNF